jgi:hypothetical protein
MTVFIGVDGAVQHGLSIMGILLILVLFTFYFLLMFVYDRFFPSLPEGADGATWSFCAHECASWSFKSPLSTNFSSKSAKTSARVSASPFTLSPPLPW